MTKRKTKSLQGPSRFNLRRHRTLTNHSNPTHENPKTAKRRRTRDEIEHENKTFQCQLEAAEESKERIDESYAELKSLRASNIQEIDLLKLEKRHAAQIINQQQEALLNAMVNNRKALDKIETLKSRLGKSKKRLADFATLGI